jgi:hypothetical protein
MQVVEETLTTVGWVEAEATATQAVSQFLREVVKVATEPEAVAVAAEAQAEKGNVFLVAPEVEQAKETPEEMRHRIMVVVLVEMLAQKPPEAEALEIPLDQITTPPIRVKVLVV